MLFRSTVALLISLLVSDALTATPPATACGTSGELSDKSLADTRFTLVSVLPTLPLVLEPNPVVRIRIAEGMKSAGKSTVLSGYPAELAV